MKYRAICHTKCYWKETLWELGDVYEGDDPPNKHFSKDGKIDNPLPPADATVDPRSTKEMIEILKDKYGIKVGKTIGRKRIFARLKEQEDNALRDGQSNPEPAIKNVRTRRRKIADGNSS